LLSWRAFSASCRALRYSLNPYTFGLLSIGCSEHVERARTLLEESLTSLRRKTYPLRVANALANTLARLGSIECELGREARAFELFGGSASFTTL
jgi:hypothetical protein